MMQPNHVESPTKLATHELRRFGTAFRTLCACPLEVRVEAGGIECAKCGAPFVRERRT